MNILHYTQHVLGIGHLFRSLAIDRALAPAIVHLVTGGPAVTLSLPENVCHHAMPALAMDSEFKAMHTVEEGADEESVWQQRQEQLLALFHHLQPEVLLIEMFPFGRKRFARELLPVLAANRERSRPALTLCSVRDILVEKDDQAKFEKKVLQWLNPYFDGVLVHSDPALIRFEQTFARTADIACPLYYTGYVAQGSLLPDRAGARRELGLPAAETLLLASAGSGTVGGELLTAIIGASIHIRQQLPHRLLMFHGPHAEKDLRHRLHRLANGHDHIEVRDFTPRFVDHVLAADLSISMAGYNTCMNVLAAGVPALVWPFGQNREQRLRAERLAGLGALQVLDDGDLKPRRLAALMADHLAGGRRQVIVDLDGAAKSAAWIVGQASSTGGRSRPAAAKNPSSAQKAVRKSRLPVSALWQTMPADPDAWLRRIFRQAKEQAASGTVSLFFRADDIGVPGRQFQELMTLFQRHRLPLALAVVPVWLTPGRWRELRALAAMTRSFGAGISTAGVMSITSRGAANRNSDWGVPWGR